MVRTRRHDGHSQLAGIERYSAQYKEILTQQSVSSLPPCKYVGDAAVKVPSLKGQQREMIFGLNQTYLLDRKKGYEIFSHIVLLLTQICLISMLFRRRLAYSPYTQRANCFRDYWKTKFVSCSLCQYIIPHSIISKFCPFKVIRHC